METLNVRLDRKTAEGFVIPLKSVNLVFVKTADGMVGCGAFDVLALDKFDYPAARVRPSSGTSIKTIDDLLTGLVREANATAIQRGVKEGMTGNEALELM